MSTPTTLNLLAPIELQAAAEGKLPRFSMVAYTGTTMRLTGWPHPVVVAMEGIDIPDRALPIRFAHESGREDGIGHTDRVAVEGGTLVAAGVVSRDTEAAREVVAAAKRGFPWQASIGATPVQVEFLKAGETATVNGRQVAGPVYIVHKSRLNEISVVDIGADPNTTTDIAATGGTQGGGNMDGTDDILARAKKRREGLQALADEYGSIIGVDADKLNAILAEAHADESIPLDTVAVQLLRASRPPAVKPVRGGTGSGINAQQAIGAALLVMAGREDLAVKAYGEPAAEYARRNRPTGWPELAMLAMSLSGRTPPRDREELIKASFSTTNLPQALGETMQRIALNTYMEESNRNWTAICRPVSAQDFREGKAIRLSPAMQLVATSSSGELKHGDLAEESYTFRCSTYGRLLTLSRTSIVNDDMGLLNDIPTVMGGEASRLTNDLAFSVLLGATSAFFDSTLGNSLTTGSALAVGSLATAIKSLRVQADRDGRIIGFKPVSLIVPATLEATARQLLTSMAMSRASDEDNVGTGNPFQGMSIQLVVEPRLDAASITAGWYLVAAPSTGPLLAAFLKGRQGPTVEPVDVSAELLGVGWRVYFDIGVSLGEYRAIVKATGSA